ncbi:MAG: ArsR family transcriptional regulator [Rhodanobacter sp.]|nr:MAG: ArsR family transcriptional regulator [Rhodanobacter sp.]
MTQKTTLDVLLHPVRMRILRAFLGRTELTARDLAEKLDDVPQATLYRHVKRLAEAGILVIASETPVRGAMERAYRVDAKTVTVPREDIGTIHPETHLKYFSAFAASLLHDFGRYARSGDVDVLRDGVHYLQVPFFATRKEFASFMDELQTLINLYVALGPARNRKQRTLSIVTLPERPTKAK